MIAITKIRQLCCKKKGSSGFKRHIVNFHSIFLASLIRDFLATAGFTLLFETQPGHFCLISASCFLQICFL